METDIEQHNVRVVIGEPITLGGTDSLPTFAYVVAATLRAHRVPRDEFIAALRSVPE